VSYLSGVVLSCTHRSYHLRKYSEQEMRSAMMIAGNMTEQQWLDRKLAERISPQEAIFQAMAGHSSSA
jgi:predicted phosphodiesterase